MKQFIEGSTDWRQSLKRNSRRTRVVIGLFFLIYFALGLLVDVFIYSGEYPTVPLSHILVALFQFKLFPLVTLIMLAVAGISLLVTYSLYDKLMLLGTEYREITRDNASSLEE